MPYAAENDIRRHLGAYAEGWPRVGGKPPTVADGLSFLESAQGDIDAILSGKGITTPVTAPTSFVNKLRDLCGMYAASLISAALFPQAAGPASMTLHEWLMKLYRVGLEDLKTGTIIPESLATSGSALPRSLWTSRPTDEDGNDNTTPTFKRSTQW